MIELYIWVVMSLLYMGTAVYFEIRYPQVDKWATLAFLLIGAAIFMGANDRYVVSEDIRPLLRIAILLVLIGAWLAGVKAVLDQVEVTEDLLDRIDDM